MTDKNDSDSEPQEEYEPHLDHYCDGYVTYEEDISLELSGEEPYDPIQEVNAECEECGRALTIVVDVGPEWLSLADRDTGETLHEY